VQPVSMQRAQASHVIMAPPVAPGTQSATGIYFLVAAVFPLATRRLPRSATAVSVLRVRYPDGRGILRDVLR
jgi:hypothetical protein